jgi:hypothetical protein
LSIQTIRILTQVNDAHAAAVAWALHRLGLDAAITCLSELAVDGRGISWRETGQVFHLTEEVPDLLWFRRPTRPIHLPGGSIDQPDQLHELANVEETLTLFVEGLEEILPGVRVLNRPSAVRRSANKVLNIQEANNAGLAVPKSIITNSINEGRSFASEMGGKVVYKPLRHSIWKVKPNVYTTARSTVVDKDFLMNIENSYLPFILQEVVHKVSEWRVVYTCGEVIIIEQTREDEFMPVDWRIDARKFSKYKKINPEIGFL